MKTKEKNKKDYLDELQAQLSPERVNRAKSKAEEEILAVKLSQLRETMGIKQKDVKMFSQSSVSKIESRKDMKISTMIEYLSSIGMRVEIRAFPKTAAKSHKKEFILLKN